MPNQYSLNHSLMHQNRHKHLLWATCFRFSTWPRASQQVSFTGRAHLTGPGLCEPSPGWPGRLDCAWSQVWLLRLKGRHREAWQGTMTFPGVR